MQPRTKRQKEVLDYIVQFVERNGYEPSYHQIARQIGVRSKGGIQRHIVALESQGLISRKRDNGSFSIVIHTQTPRGADSLSDVEMIEINSVEGSWIEGLRTTIAVPMSLAGDLPASEVICVRIPDDSLMDKHICEDDVVLFEKRNYARRGQTVAVALVDGQIRVGQYYHAGVAVELRPGNPEYESIHIPSDELTILGVMRGLLRTVPQFDA